MLLLDGRLVVHIDDINMKRPSGVILQARAKTYNLLESNLEGKRLPEITISHSQTSETQDQK